MAKPRAIFKSGVPANLPAAAMDAREWLEVMQLLMARDSRFAEDKARLARCIEAIDKYLPDEEAHD